MKRYCITAVFLGAVALVSCRNFTSVSSTEAQPANILHCSQEAEGECAEPPVDQHTVDITSPLGIFLMN